MGPKSTRLNFSLNLPIAFFRSCVWWQAVNSGSRQLFWIFQGRSYYVQNEVNGRFWGQKSAFLKSALNLLGFCEVVLDNRHRELVNVTVLVSYEKFLLYSKWRKSERFLSQNQHYNFSLINIFITRFFYKKHFYKKMSLKNQKPWENVKKISNLKCLSCDF